MIHAYDKSYLSSAQKNLARMLDYMVNDLKHSLETVWQWFLMSKTSHRFERGDCSVLSGMSGVELARMVLQESGQSIPDIRPSYACDRSPEYWTGWAIAYYQWDTGLHFDEIERAVHISDIRLLYTPYHEIFRDSLRLNWPNRQIFHYERFNNTSSARKILIRLRLKLFFGFLGY